MGKNRNPDKRQNIIDSALSLFGNTHDVKKVSLESIAKAAGVSPTTIYNSFGSREKLIFEVIKVLINQSMESNRLLIQSALPFPQKMAAVVSGKQDLIAQYNSELVNKIMSQDEGMRPYIDRLYETEIKPLWECMIKDGKKQGYIDPGLDETALMIYLDVIKAGFAGRQDLLKSLTASPEMLRGLTKIMFYGFLNRDIELFKEA